MGVTVKDVCSNEAPARSRKASRRRLVSESLFSVLSLSENRERFLSNAFISLKNLSRNGKIFKDACTQAKSLIRIYLIGLHMELEKRAAVSDSYQLLWWKSIEFLASRLPG